MPDSTEQIGIAALARLNAKLTKQRDELRAALEGMLAIPGMEFIHEGIVESARAALAKARGESDAGS